MYYYIHVCTSIISILISNQAIEDIGNLAIGKWQQMMVPNNQMADVLRVVKDAANSNLKQGSWVRIKRGIYRDDIAQVCVASKIIHVHTDLRKRFITSVWNDQQSFYLYIFFLGAIHVNFQSIVSLLS